jgi:DNA-directed RNA polymerase subunit RPC12/RpoP
MTGDIMRFEYISVPLEKDTFKCYKCETVHQINFNEPITCCNQLYYLSQRSPDGNGIVKGRELPTEVDSWGTDEIVCPRCGYEHGDSWEMEADSDDMECQECGVKFHYERCVTVDYTTSLCDEE